MKYRLTHGVERKSLGCRYNIPTGNDPVQIQQQPEIIKRLQVLSKHHFTIATLLKMEKPGNLVEKFVTSADGTKVFAGALGNPEKPSLIFVHGWTLNSSIFNELFTKLELSKEFYLVSDDYWSNVQRLMFSGTL